MVLREICELKLGCLSKSGSCWMSSSRQAGANHVLLWFLRRLYSIPIGRDQVQAESAGALIGIQLSVQYDLRNPNVFR